MSSASGSATQSVSTRGECQARPWHHYSNWLWVIMFAVMIGGWFYPLIGLAVLVCFAGAIITGAFWGRKWCGTMCPRGNFWDRIMSKVLRNPRVPAWARNKAVRVGVLVALMGAMVTQLVFAWGSWEAVGRVFVLLLTVTTVIGVLMAFTGHQRAWCAVCPAGTMASWLGKGKGQQLCIAHDSCTQCTACHHVCPMDLEPSEMACTGGPTHPDCLKCSACVRRCRQEALTLTSERRQPATTAADKEEQAA